MQDNPSIKLTLEQRKLILELMNYSYIIPGEFHECVRDAIKRYATKSYSEETINKMVQKSQSIAHSGFLIREDNLSLFRGKFAEWLACIEYNSLKNSGSVIMTIVNPDETSKADLLHFIKIGNEFKAVAGPDVKSGGSTYVFNQWKKIVTSRHDIPMVDFDGVLTTEEGLKKLTKKQREEFDELAKQYPLKKPIPSQWINHQDELRLRLDYFKNIINMDGSFEYSPEVVNVLKKALFNQSNAQLLQSDWTEFNAKCKEIFAASNLNMPALHKTSSSTNVIPSKKSSGGSPLNTIELRQTQTNNRNTFQDKSRETAHNKKQVTAKDIDDGKIKFSIKGFLKYFAEGIVSVGLPIVADAVVSNVVKKSRGGSSNVASPESSAVVDHVDHSVERNQPDERNYPDERLGPKEHDVTGYVRQQYGKTVHVNAYKRGGNKDQT